MHMYTNSQKEAVGIRVVETFIREPWNCRWQEYEARNDNGIDGVAIMRKGEKETGGLVFIQVKCGGNGYRQDQKQYSDKVCISLGEKYIEDHRPRWNVTPGPCVIVFVDDTIDKKMPPAWWADLKDDSTYSPTNKGMLLLPKSQRFGAHSKGDFHRLCGTGPIDRVLPTLELTRHDLIVPQLKDTLLHAARRAYKAWGTGTNPSLGEILVNRVGWRHITRQGRLRERIWQSLELIGVAKKIVNEIDEVDMLGRTTIKDYPDGTILLTDHLGLRANILFPHRHQSVVQVVLKRERIVTKKPSVSIEQKIWFLSVYELRRGVKQV
ncbi:MAG: DUF4365 domain-containing protein [Burkholderiales bacterium]